MAVIATLVLVLALAFAVDADWFRGPLNTFISHTTEREFSSKKLAIRWGWPPTVQLFDVHFENSRWAAKPIMAKVAVVELTISARDIFRGGIFLPRLALTDAELNLERLPDNRRNWLLSEPSDTGPGRLRIGRLAIERGVVTYVDHSIPLKLSVDIDTFDPSSRPPYTTRMSFEGTYDQAKFSGNALTGDVVSLQQSALEFPIQLHLTAGTTTLDVDGTIADVVDLAAIDVSLRMSGATLANLYPFLLLPLPASPPYALQGRLTRDGTEFRLRELHGIIGSTDVAGEATYVQRAPRPLLTAKLASTLLDLSDLGPLVGVTTKSVEGDPATTQADTSTRSVVIAKQDAATGDRVIPSGLAKPNPWLPSGAFDGRRLTAIDADVSLSADKVAVPDKLAMNDVRAKLELKDGVMHIDPFDVDLAGGKLASRIVLDATQPTMRATFELDARRLSLAHLLPSTKKIVGSRGLVGGRLELAGEGRSIADIAATSNGEVVAVISDGEISNLLDAAAGLNGGKVIQLLVGGDKNIAIRCAAAAFDVENGQGRSTVFVVDTAETRIDGAGGFDLDNERFGIVVAPLPKNAGVLSARTPIKVHGSFRKADFELDKSTLALRAGSVAALALVAPLAALIPLIETGPGTDANCQALFASAREPATNPPQRDG